MKLTNSFYKILKNGLYLDYLFKNLIFFFYKKIVGKNSLFVFDKYFTEYLFFLVSSFFNNLSFVIGVLKNLNFNQITKLILIIAIQIIIIIIL